MIVVVAGVGAGMSLRVLSPTYSSDSTVVISCKVAENADKEYRLQYTSILASRINSGLALANATQMKQSVADQLGIPVSEIIDIKATQNQNAPSIKITTSTNDADVCAKVSDTACSLLANQMKQMFPTPEPDRNTGRPRQGCCGGFARDGGSEGRRAWRCICCDCLFYFCRAESPARQARAQQRLCCGSFQTSTARYCRKWEAHCRRVPPHSLGGTAAGGDGRSLLVVPVSKNSRELELVSGLARSLAGSKRKCCCLTRTWKHQRWQLK